MATRKPAAVVAPELEPELKVVRADLEKQLTERVTIGKELHERQIGSEAALREARQAYRTWDEYNTTLLRRSFSTAKPSDVYSAEPGFFISGGEEPLHSRIDDYRGDVSGRLRRLESIVGQLPLYEQMPGVAASATKSLPTVGSGVFIVHGHANALKQEVARAVQRLTGAEPVILHEQADRGRTIIEKFEQHAGEVGFAVVLLTADDTGGAADGDQRPRARQNVVFELGYFFGRLGRSSVAVLYESGVELPSDVHGVLYTEVDAGGAWQYQLGRELRAAGIEADLNKLA